MCSLLTVVEHQNGQRGGKKRELHFAERFKPWNIHYRSVRFITQYWQQKVIQYFGREGHIWLISENIEPFRPKYLQGELVQARGVSTGSEPKMEEVRWEMWALPDCLACVPPGRDSRHKVVDLFQIVHVHIPHPPFPPAPSISTYNRSGSLKFTTGRKTSPGHWEHGK